MQLQRQIDRLMAQRAAEWMEILREGDRRDHEAFVEWLQQSKLHIEHYLDMECLDRQIRALDRHQGPDIGALLAKAAPNVLSFDPRVPEGRENPGARRRHWLAAATVAGIIFLAGMFVVWHRPAHHVATSIGEQRTLTLPDGSLILMNVDTDLQIDYSEKHRNIDLVSGEAVFKVSHDPVRPFVVRTSTAAVQAVGTQFNVYQRNFTVVSVLEGRVHLTTQSSNGFPQTREVTESLDAGEEAQVTDGRIEKRTHPDVAKTVAWRERRLYFDDMPLGDIVREFNRYGGPVRLRLEGTGAELHRFGGTFNADDPLALADILEQQKGLLVERRRGEILIRSRHAD